MKPCPRSRISPRNFSPDSGARSNAIVEPTNAPTKIPIRKPNILRMMNFSFTELFFFSENIILPIDWSLIYNFSNALTNFSSTSKPPCQNFAERMSLRILSPAFVSQLTDC
jgi:hypothetical protein